MRSSASRLRRAIAFAMTLAMVTALPAYAAPSLPDSDPTPALPDEVVPDPVDPDPAPQPDADASTESSTGADASDETTGSPLDELPRTPDDKTRSKLATDSAILVPPDPETERFRRELAEKQARIAAFKAELDALDRELAISVEEYNAAVEELGKTKEHLSATAEDLEKARAAYDAQSELFRSRIRDLYASGNGSAMEVLLHSKSVTDFFERLRFLQQMSSHDGSIADELHSRRNEIERDLMDLDTAELQARALEFDLKARQVEIVLRIEERQALLASAEVELADFLQDEAARRDVEQRMLMQSILEGADEVGIEIVPAHVIETALAYHGIPYVWGGETPAGFDCSGLVLYVFRQHGVELPHYSGSQFRLGERVLPQQLRAGDVVFFGSPIHHVGIYMGAGYYLHAPKTGDFVKVSRLADRSDYAGARRYDWQPRVAPIRGLSAEEASATTNMSTIPIR